MSFPIAYISSVSHHQGKRMTRAGIYRRVINGGDALSFYLLTVSVFPVSQLRLRAMRMTATTATRLNPGERPAGRIARSRRNEKNVFISFRERPSVTMPTTSVSLPIKGDGLFSPSLKYGREASGNNPSGYQFCEYSRHCPIYNDEMIQSPHWLIWNKCPSAV